jgi:hypothetical protein
LKIEVRRSKKHRVFWIQDEDTSELICDFYAVISTGPSRFRAFKNAKKNAHEIAKRYNAHEDLLAALEVSARFVLALYEGDSPPTQEIQNLRSTLNAAIAKAKGE